MVESNKKDLKYKYEVYEQSGVKEYWVIFPREHAGMIYTLVNGSYRPSRLLVEGDCLQSSVLPGFSLDLAKLFDRMI